MGNNSKSKYDEIIPDFNEMKPGVIYVIEDSSYAVVRDKSYGLTLLRGEHHFTSPPDKKTIYDLIDFKHEYQVHKGSDKLYAGIVKNKECVALYDTADVVKMAMEDKGIEQYEIVEFNSFLDYSMYISSNKIKSRY